MQPGTYTLSFTSGGQRLRPLMGADESRAQVIERQVNQNAPNHAHVNRGDIPRQPDPAAKAAAHDTDEAP